MRRLAVRYKCTKFYQAVWSHIPEDTIVFVICEKCYEWGDNLKSNDHHHHHHHHHVQERLGLIPVPCKSSKWNWFLHLFLGRPMCLRSFGLYCSACLGSLFVSILCMCCSHFSWYCFISFTIFSGPVFFPNILVFFLYLVLLFQEGVLKISSVLLLNVVTLFSSVPRLHFRISMLL